MQQLIRKGFNPFVWLYSHNKRILIKYSNRFTKLAAESNRADFWYTFEDSKCEPTCSEHCPDKKAKFIYSDGSRVRKIKCIGKGGFGSVYAGRVHETEIAAKFIDVTTEYREIMQVGTIESKTGVKSLNPSHVLKVIVGDVAYEASAQREFGHKNILKAKEWWLQWSKGYLIELVISTPKCYLNLKNWVETEKFNFDQICRFLVETCEALEYLAGKNLAHRDVKPANILISERLNPTAKLNEFGR